MEYIIIIFSVLLFAYSAYINKNNKELDIKSIGFHVFSIIILSYILLDNDFDNSTLFLTLLFYIFSLIPIYTTLKENKTIKDDEKIKDNLFSIFAMSMLFTSLISLTLLTVHLIERHMFVKKKELLTEIIETIDDSMAYCIYSKEKNNFGCIQENFNESIKRITNMKKEELDFNSVFEVGNIELINKNNKYYATVEHKSKENLKITYAYCEIYNKEITGSYTIKEYSEVNIEAGCYSKEDYFIIIKDLYLLNAFLEGDITYSPKNTDTDAEDQK